MTCLERVWGNGDMEQCTRPTIPGKAICQECMDIKLPDLRVRLARAEAEVAVIKQKIAEIE